MAAIASTSGRLLDCGSSSAMCGTRLPSVTRLAPAARQQRMQAVRPSAALGRSKKYNKYLSRHDLEKATYREWELTTKLTEEEMNRPMTTRSLLAFLPTWFKFYAVPGPVRFVWYFVWMAAQQVGYQLRKQAVIVGAKLDGAVLARRGSRAGYRLRETALLRLHGKQSILAPLRVMLLGR